MHDYELRVIDAWRYDDRWIWNISFRVRDVSILEGSEEAELLSYIAPEERAEVYVACDGDVFELRERETDEPIMALVPEMI